MTEYKIGKAIVRMHGTPDRENLEAATARFLAKVEQHRRKQAKKGGETNARNQTAVRGV